jgi:hypothetical protein
VPIDPHGGAVAADGRPWTSREARTLIDRILQTPDCINWTTHARTRSVQRQFTHFDVRLVLEHGYIRPGDFDDLRKTWRYLVSGYDIDGDPLTVVVAIDEARGVISVITGI